MLDAILENDHKLTASQRGNLRSTTMFRIWAYGRGVGGAWSTTTSVVLGVKKLHYNSTVYVLIKHFYCERPPNCWTKCKVHMYCQ